MKTILLLLVLTTAIACASKPKHNSVTFAETSSEAEEKLKDFPMVDAQYEFVGYKVATKDCSFLRTIHLEIIPTPTENFAKMLKKRIEPKTIMGLNAGKTARQSNPCSRLAMYTSMKNIRNQGSKKKFDDKALLAKADLGIAPGGQAYLKIVFYEKNKNEAVKVMDPGYFLTYELAKDMTDDEIAEWIISTVYHVGWK